MHEQIETAFEQVAEKLGGVKQHHFVLLHPDGEEVSVYVVKHATGSKVALLLDGMKPIEFDTPQGKQIWINTWAPVAGSRYFVINDGPGDSLGFYALDGSSVWLNYKSPYDTPELIFRVMPSSLAAVDGNPYLLRPMISSIFDLPAYGPQ